MPRVRIGAARNRSRKRILRGARGYYGARKSHRYLAKDAIIRGGAFAYAHRRLRKRDMRKLWITRITAACKLRGARYSLFITGLKLANIDLNRKMLSEIAIHDPETFDKLVEQAKAALEAKQAA